MSAIVSQFMGLGISSVQLGIAVAQGFYYYRSFPCDKRLVKCLVFIQLFMTALSTALSCLMFWAFFANCSPSNHNAPECLLWTKTTLILFFLTAIMPFVVQSFYCHRIWIITGGNVRITTPIALFAVASCGLSLAVIPQTLGAFVSLTPLALGTVGAVTGFVCDCTISISVYIYLHPSRYAEKRVNSRIEAISHNFIGVGILTCSLAMFISILLLAKLFPPVGGVGILLRNSYANSLLVILNARKPPAERPRSMNVELLTEIIRTSESS